MPFTFYCLGSLEFRKDKEIYTPKIQEKTRAIVAYLATMRVPQTRAHLANLLCSEANDRAASLRWHLSRIRKAFGSSLLRTEKSLCSLNIQRHDTDVFLFEKRIQELGQTDPELHEWISALQLYRGPFLQDIQIKNAPHFEIWLTGERNRLSLVFERAAQQCIQKALDAEKHLDAIRIAQRWVELDPLREETHSLLMWLYARNGQREAASKQYELCKQLRKEQLDVPLLEETEELYTQVIEGDFSPMYTDLIRPPRTAKRRTSTHAIDTSSIWSHQQKQLDTIQEHWSNATSSQRTHYLIMGELGVGKSYLIEAFTRTLTHTYICTARSYTSEQTQAYHACSILMDQWLYRLGPASLELPSQLTEQLGRISPKWALKWGVPAPEWHEEQPHRHLFAAFLMLLERILEAERHVCIWLDDIHWMDLESLHMLDYTIRMTQHVPIVWITCTTPTAWTPENPGWSTWKSFTQDCTQYTLSSFSKTQLLHVLNEHIADVDPDIAKQWSDVLWEQTAGHPLYAFEWLNALQGDPQTLPKLHTLPSIRSILEAQLRLWSRQELYMFELMIAFERPITWMQLSLASALSEDECTTWLDRATKEHILRDIQEDENLTFCIQHIPMQELVIEQWSALHRQRLHKRTAQALEKTGTNVAIVAHHWRCAGVPQKEYEALQRSAQESILCYAYPKAAQDLRRCAQLTHIPHEHVRCLHESGRLFRLAGLWSDAEDTLQRALKYAQQHQLQHAHAESALALGELAYQQGALPMALQWCGRAQQLFDIAQHPAREAYVWGELGKIQRRLGDFKKSIKAYQNKLQLVREHDLSTHRLREVYGALFGIYIQTYQMDQALLYFQKTLECSLQDEESPDSTERLLQEAGHMTISRMMEHTGAFSHQQDRYMEALSYVEQQLVFLDQSGQSQRVRSSLKQLGTWYAWMGDYTRAISFVIRLFDLAIEECSFLGLSRISGNLGELYFASGALETAYMCYLYRLSISLDLKEKRNITTTLFRLGQLAICLEQFDEAERLTQHAIDLGQRLQLHHELETFHHTMSTLYQQKQKPIKAKWHQDKVAPSAVQIHTHSSDTHLAFPLESQEHTLPEPPLQIRTFHKTLPSLLKHIQHIWS